jgi:hypothetical protein
VGKRELSPGAFARALGRSERTVRRWCAAKKIRCRTIPGKVPRYWIPEAELTRLTPMEEIRPQSVQTRTHGGRFSVASTP